MVFENKKIVFKSYHQKLQFLDQHSIALWDIYGVAERKGSLDVNINIKGLLSKYHNIKKILVNGRKAEKALKQYMKINPINCNYQYVPSSSSANRRYSLMEKVMYWKEKINK